MTTLVAPTLRDVIGTIERCSEGKFRASDIQSVFCWGSRVYGTHREDSDYDYIAISSSTSCDLDDLLETELQQATKTSVPLIRGRARTRGHVYDDNMINVSVLYENSWRRMIREHRLEMLESLWLPDTFVLCCSEEHRHFMRSIKLDMTLLRLATDFEAGRTFNKVQNMIQSSTHSYLC
jgi:predicted nucleotidyltransferase